MWHIEPFIKASPYVGGWLLHLKEIESTNDLALNSQELLKKSGLVIVADTQSGGRGRKGRTWCSHINGNLYSTFVLHDVFQPPVMPYITLLAGLAVYDTLIGFGVDNASIKWPNDCLINGKKVAGILVETKEVDSNLHVMVIGIGVNIRGKVDDFPQDLQQKVTTLEAEFGRSIDRFHFLRSLIENTNDILREFSTSGAYPLIDRWISSSSSIGRSVVVTEGDDSVKGEIVGLSDKGFLLLKLEDGRIIEIISGDVEFI